MALPALPYNFHDSHLVDVLFGLRNDIILTLALTDPRQETPCVHVRFGGITNLNEVHAYFAHVTPPTEPNAYLACVDQLAYAASTPSYAHHLIFQLDVDGYGQLLIHCRNIAMRTDEQADFTFT